MSKVVIACLGTTADLESIRARADAGAEVIAVAFDLGRGAPLQEIHDLARGAGASKCHVLDVREEYLRDYILPSAGNLRANPDELAATLMAQKLAEIAALEGAGEIVPPSTHREIGEIGMVRRLSDVVCRDERSTTNDERPLAPRSPRPPCEHVDRPAHLEIALEAGVPVSINGVSMSLVEIMDSLDALARAHAIGGSWPALTVLAAALSPTPPRARALGFVETGPTPLGSVETGARLARLQLFRGEVTSAAGEPVAT